MAEAAELEAEPAEVKKPRAKRRAKRRAAAKRKGAKRAKTEEERKGKRKAEEEGKKPRKRRRRKRKKAKEKAIEPPSDPKPADEAASEEEKICRFCFEGESQEMGELVAPCKCSGGQKWVHLHCLRRWQRGVLSALPSYPGLVAENRQKICNVCCTAFTIPPPTHMELLELYTGTKAVKLIAEGNFIASHKGFSGLLCKQLAALPAPLRRGVGHRHWIRGVFLIVRVITTSAARSVRLRIDDEEDLQAFARQLEDNWAFEMHGRPLHVSREGPLANTSVPADAEAATIRRAVLALTAPVTLTLKSPQQSDGGEDGVIAVNLTRPIGLQSYRDSYKRATFAAAVAAILKQGGAEALLPSVRHFIGGPCDEDEASCCIVIGGGEEPYTVHHSLLEGLREAQRRSGGQDVVEGPLVEEDEGEEEEQSPVSGSSPPKRRKSAVAEAAPTAAEAEAAPREEVRLLVFWGSAGWSRRQLLGETARGSWGLCKAEVADVVDGSPGSVWEAVYPRLAFAPESEISEDYVAAPEEDEPEPQDGPEEEDPLGPEHVQWDHLRRFLARTMPPTEESEEEQPDDSSSEEEESSTSEAAHEAAVIAGREAFDASRRAGREAGLRALRAARQAERQFDAQG